MQFIFSLVSKEPSNSKKRLLKFTNEHICKSKIISIETGL